MPPADEVRRCAKCAEPAVVLVFEWKHTYNGISSGTSTRDYRCQSCGARFSIHPKVSSWTFIVIGLVLAWGVLPLGFTIFGWWRLRRDSINPVVPGAPRPLMRFKDGPPQRRCGTCQHPVALTRVTRRASRGMPTGTEYEYACQPCKKTFVIESLWGHCVSIMGAGLLAAITGGLLIAATHPGWRYGGGAVALALTVFWVIQTAQRIANHFSHPVID